jgi:hypothetical protein
VRTKSAAKIITDIYMSCHTSMAFHPGASLKVVKGRRVLKSETMDMASGFASQMAGFSFVDELDSRASCAFMIRMVDDFGEGASDLVYCPGS